MNLKLSKKLTHKPRPVTSTENLRRRVERLLCSSPKSLSCDAQLSLELPETFREEDFVKVPTSSIVDFLQFLIDSLPDGDVYLFGGVLRDLALLGSKGFSSDVDVVVEGEWKASATYLEHLGAVKNKFGGYRLEVAGWKVDVWNAKETWAIKQGLIPYQGIASLTQTTVLNWDAVLMNWRTRAIIFREGYLDQIQSRILDVVLEQNPDPLGMAVRVFRHLCLKDAKSVTPKALSYLANCTAAYHFSDLVSREIQSYGKSVIEEPMYRFFQHIRSDERLPMADRIAAASENIRKELGEIPLLAV